jgi:hypothetical protein
MQDTEVVQLMNGSNLIRPYHESLILEGQSSPWQGLGVDTEVHCASETQCHHNVYCW